MIIKKGQSGDILQYEEKEALMLHALDLLKFIETETLASIGRAYIALEHQHKIAA